MPMKQPKRGRLWLGDGSCLRLRPEHQNHVWSYDFVEDRTHDGRKLRMLNIIDEFTRECLAIRVGRRLRSIDVIDVLSDLFILRGVPSFIRSDNVLCREAALGFGQQVSSRRRIADVGGRLIQMVSTVNGIAPSHSKHRIHRRRSDRGPHRPQDEIRTQVEGPNII